MYKQTVIIFAAIRDFFESSLKYAIFRCKNDEICIPKFQTWSIHIDDISYIGYVF